MEGGEVRENNIILHTCYVLILSILLTISDFYTDPISYKRVGSKGNPYSVTYSVLASTCTLHHH